MSYRLRSDVKALLPLAAFTWLDERWRHDLRKWGTGQFRASMSNHAAMMGREMVPEDPL